jgi:uncharacterized protein (TIGR00725 family)
MSSTRLHSEPADPRDRGPLVAGMPMKIGVMGGASGDIPREHLEKAWQLGQAVARRGCVLITGACPGLPFAAAGGAKEAGGLVIGISPGLSLDEHLDKYQSPAEWHDVLIFTGSGLMGREVVNIRSADIVVIIGGRSGTLGELAIAYDEGKLIGVLTGTGGISDIVPSIIAACAKETGARIVYEADPNRLVAELLRVYRAEHHRRPSCFASGAGHPVHVFRTARDVVCGMWMDPQSAGAERVSEGQKYLFCSAACAARFDADPVQYTSGLRTL